MAGQMMDDDDQITGINVTPLVDVMLVLLIIFMVTTSYIVHKSIEVKLPSAETATNVVQESKSLGFVLDADSKLYLDGKEISLSEIAVLIPQAKAKAKEAKQQLQALITADEKTPHGQVVKLIDTVRKNGITEFAINVEAAPAKKVPIKN